MCHEHRYGGAPVRILLAEDDEATRKGILVFLRAEGYQPVGVGDGGQALAALREGSYDLLVSDIRMPGMDGLALLAKLREEGRPVPVVMMTAYATVEQAVKALQSGAEDYLTKPLNLEELAIRIRRVAARLSLVRENRRLHDHLHKLEFPEMAGAGREMDRLRKEMCRLAGDADVPVMIYGESGTGKELVARTIHCQSPRAHKRFVDVSCAAIPDELLESELFGYRKGAFTGAFHDKEGLLQAAGGGTLFLDEVGEMSLRMQSRLLRFLQEYTVLPVGATVHRTVDVRVLGASNRDLHGLVEAGKFREDLYYRMNVVEVRLAPLRDRREDIPLLVDHFLRKHGNGRQRQLRFSREAYDCLESHVWPGNIRELENVVRVLLVTCEKEEVAVEDLPERLRKAAAGTAPVRPDWQQARYGPALRAVTRSFETEYLQYHLSAHGGNISQTAAAIGISRVALHQKIRQFGLTCK